MPPKQVGRVGQEGEDAENQGDSSAIEAFQQVQERFPAISKPSSLDTPYNLPTTTTARQQKSTAPESLDQEAGLAEHLSEKQNGLGGHEVLPSEKQTILYLAYGSNLASATFKGRRGIKPLSQLNVLVPELRLTFDQPGIPYWEPCFAATHHRQVPKLGDKSRVENKDRLENGVSEKAPLMGQEDCDYSQERWNKPLVGVVYEVTLSDYAMIIATEGGGRGYQDIIIDCYPFPEAYKATDPVPEHPSTKPLKAHSLLSPSAREATNSHAVKQIHKPQKRRSLLPLDRYTVQPGSYTQPSARYLKLLTQGAAEHDLPISYRTYLAQIRPYSITTTRQRIGRYIFAACWGPLMLLIMFLGVTCAGKDGRSPSWLGQIGNVAQRAMWGSYHAVFRRIFGDGERTIGDTRAVDDEYL